VDEGADGFDRASGVAGLPFPEAPPLTLLGFDPTRRDPELEYDAFGHTSLPHVDLVSTGAPASALRIEAPKIFALHSADDGDAYPDDIDLEFWVDDDTAVVVSLALFLERRAGPLIGDAPCLVLALCNPHRARLRRPEAVEVSVPIYYAEGDVIAYLDVEEDARPWTQERVSVRLVADRWVEL